MKGISNNITLFLKQNDYPRNLRQINIFKERYKPGICQINWYVFGICQKKKPNAVYNAVNTGFGM